MSRTADQVTAYNQLLAHEISQLRRQITCVERLRREVAQVNTQSILLQLASRPSADDNNDDDTAPAAAATPAPPTVVTGTKIPYHYRGRRQHMRDHNL